MGGWPLVGSALEALPVVGGGGWGIAVVVVHIEGDVASAVVCAGGWAFELYCCASWTEFIDYAAFHREEFAITEGRYSTLHNRLVLSKRAIGFLLFSKFVVLLFNLKLLAL